MNNSLSLKLVAAAVLAGVVLAFADASDSSKSASATTSSEASTVTTAVSLTR